MTIIMITNKKVFLFLFWFMIVSSLYGQNTITYSYDSAGNRIERAPVETNLVYKLPEAETTILDFFMQPTHKAIDFAIAMRGEDVKEYQSVRPPSSLLRGDLFCVLSTFEEQEPSNRYYQASLNEDRRYTKNMGYCKIE